MKTHIFSFYDRFPPRSTGLCPQRLRTSQQKFSTNMVNITNREVGILRWLGQGAEN